MILDTLFQYYTFKAQLLSSQNAQVQVRSPVVGFKVHVKLYVSCDTVE